MNAETILAYLGSALGILGVASSYYFYRKSIRIKEPVYSIKSVNVISDYSSKYENLAVSYKGEKVENFTVSKILFYNRGSETITRKDLDNAHHLSLMTNSANLLDARILQVNKESNNFQVSLEKDGGWVSIDFDYLDKNQGAVIEVIHTGLSANDIRMFGDIIGVEKLTQVEPKRISENKPMKRGDKRFLGAFLLAAFLLWYLNILAPNQLNSLLQSRNFFVILFVLYVLFGGAIGSIVLFVLVLTPVIGLFGTEYTLPKGLEKFLD